MARTFDGTGDFLQHSTAIATLDDFSIGYWAKTSTALNSKAFFGIIEDGTNELINILTNLNDLGANEANTTRIHIRKDGTPKQYIGDFNDATVYDGAWHHHLLTRSSGTVLFYLDGISKTLSNVDTSLTTDQLTFARTFAFGARNNRGTIDLHIIADEAEIAIWDDDLTAPEAASLGKGFSPLLVRPQNLLRYWPVIGRASPEIELINGDNFTVSGDSVVSAHPRIIYPSFAQSRRFTTAVAAGTAIKTYQGLAVASVKTYNGLAYASIKKFNGLQ